MSRLCRQGYFVRSRASIDIGPSVGGVFSELPHHTVPALLRDLPQVKKGTSHSRSHFLGHAESYAARIANQTTGGDVVVSPARARTPRADGRVRLRRAARRRAQRHLEQAPDLLSHPITARSGWSPGWHAARRGPGRARQGFVRPRSSDEVPPVRRPHRSLRPVLADDGAVLGGTGVRDPDGVRAVRVGDVDVAVEGVCEGAHRSRLRLDGRIHRGVLRRHRGHEPVPIHRPGDDEAGVGAVDRDAPQLPSLANPLRVLVHREEDAVALR